MLIEEIQKRPFFSELSQQDQVIILGKYFVQNISKKFNDRNTFMNSNSLFVRENFKLFQ